MRRSTYQFVQECLDLTNSSHRVDSEGSSSKARLKQSTVRSLGGLAALLVVPPIDLAGSVNESSLEHLPDGGPLSFSFDVVPPRP